jgi:prolipoprotein diacylglyceryltransferase
MMPVLFTLGWIDVPSFTALMALALGAGLALTWRQVRRMNIPSPAALDTVLAAVLLGVIGARALHVATNWDYYRAHAQEIARLWQGGLWWQGGVLGGAIGMAGVSVLKRPTRDILNALAPGLMAGAALGWLGCYLAGVAYGREIFPGQVWWFLAADLPDAFGLWNPRFPVQLFGAAWAAVCCIISNVELRMSNGRYQRFAFASALALYSAGMVALGLARGDPAPMLGGWRLDQALDAGIAVAAIIYGLSNRSRFTFHV